MTDKIILLVEDNADDELLTRRAFQKNNILNEVVVAHDGVEALDYLFATGPHEGRSLNPPPAVILLDINLPRIGGLEVLRRLRADERTRMLPVVVLTSSREEQDLVDSYRLGVNAYVVKPVAFEAFVKAVKDLGVFWALVNEPPPGDARRLHPRP